MTTPARERRWSSPPVAGLIVLAVAAVVAVNAAGIWGIAVARRGVAEESARIFHLAVEARAHALESTLAATRADLAFLAGSPTLYGLGAALASKDPREARWRRLGAEGALLLFLRGHAEVAHLSVTSNAGAPLVEAGRRGGVPVLWMIPAIEIEGEPATAGGAPPRSGGDAVATAAGAARAARSAVTAAFQFSPSGRPDPLSARLAATLDAGALLARGRAEEILAGTCALLDAHGRSLAEEPGSPQPAPGGRSAITSTTDGTVATAPPGAGSSAPGTPDAPVRTGGWSAPSPWRLTCAQGSGSAVALLDPIAARYRTTLLLNVAVMGLAVLLGGFVIHQARRRDALEAHAAEEARIRELERQLFHAERLSTVGRLAAGIAHEINNPLEGMSNYLRLAREDVARGDVAAAARRLESVHEGLRRAASVVRQVLQHADPATAPRVPVDVGALLRESAEFVRTRGEFAGVAMDVDVDGAPLTVRGDAATLSQVFLNLLLNACEAQPAGGEVRAAAWRNSAEVLVEIADRGPGVKAADAERIFEPFYTTKGSTGLGLSICWTIVRQHQGELSVESRTGGGALFRLKLPAAEGSDAG